MTGDPLSSGEYISWKIQHVMRRWAFLGAITAITALCWLTNNMVVLTWWNLGASYLAIVIEGITAMALINQTLRDAVVSREVRRLTEQQAASLSKMAQLEERHEIMLAAIVRLLEIIEQQTQSDQETSV